MRLPPTMAACGLCVDNAVINRTVAVEIERLRRLVDGRWGPIREEVRGQIRASALLRPVHGLPTEEYRVRVLEQARLVSQTRSARLFFPRQYGGGEGIGGGAAAFVEIGVGELSLFVQNCDEYGAFRGGGP